jgi:hypothetical protein
VPTAAAPLNAFGNRLISTFFFNHTLATDYAANMISAAVASVLASFTSEWQHGLMDNFTYLMVLNSCSGRSYSDLTQYPVMPWILADYDSAELDLSNPASFRDLSKPMGALDERRANMHRNKYRETEALWKDEEREAAAAGRNSAPADSGAGGGGFDSHHTSHQRGGMSANLMHGSSSNGVVPPDVSRAYHYATHYSSAAVVMYYMFRVAPFSQFLVQFQSGRFDRADRLWSSIKQTWLTASRLLSGDVKELIPELFYFPQMLRNGNQLDLGRRQDGRPVNDVLLPPWAKGSPREFVRLHRLALESDWVSARLHEWIDLVSAPSWHVTKAACCRVSCIAHTAGVFCAMVASFVLVARCSVTLRPATRLCVPSTCSIT